MANSKFSIKESLSYGWTTFTSHIGFFIGFMLVLGAVTVIPDLIVDRMFLPRSGGYVVGKLLVRALGLLLGMVATRVSLDIHDKGTADLSKLGDLAGLLPSYLGGKILYGLIVLVGMILLIVPGIIAAYMFLYVGYLIVDKGLGPIEALKASKSLTDGVKMDLFLFSLVMALVNLAGMLVVFVGLLATIPTTLMAAAYVYRKLSPAGA